MRLVALKALLFEEKLRVKVAFDSPISVYGFVDRRTRSNDYLICEDDEVAIDESLCQHSPHPETELVPHLDVLAFKLVTKSLMVEAHLEVLLQSTLNSRSADADSYLGELLLRLSDLHTLVGAVLDLLVVLLLLSAGSLLDFNDLTGFNKG